mmetsp:Transcript_45485/g.119499  ORF Transcript_45485/g.119499 Transcript_45485/m.119499 type:complete len:654 (+) Transcript_45485:39-2000(+)|eukprot:CAMPEP_0115839214 /NCGR_PEP_ID=MMETSP0287-20121206/6137_1 /TAXON_ID=412157 /ORGANISM="Chrysochromulina rotalis, Strain UIO044" /LENGTH=653 /DNA_ID=CAMNT_0003292781 /DNA_START=172 /DNA_END=2133 /DNA_ORIENTATION=+
MISEEGPSTEERFYVLINKENSLEIETSASGVSWRLGPPIESGERAEELSEAERSAEQSALRYYPLHPRLFQSTSFPHDWLDPRFAAAIQAGTPADLTSLLTDEVPGLVFSFDMVTSDFCTLLLEELEHYEASGLPVRRPNTMNSYGLVVNQIGLKPLLDDLQQSCLLPLSRLLYPVEGSSFDHHHSFMVKYRKGEDTHLDMHHDDAEVTLNICLGKSFTGATLSFCGVVGESGHRMYTHRYAHQLGRAVLHKGAQRHGADEILEGERISLIMWAKSSTYRMTDAYLHSHLGWRRTHPGKPAPRPRANAGDGEAGHDSAATASLGAAEDEDGSPDPVCLSETHDADYGEHAPFRPGISYRPQERRAFLQSFTSIDASTRADALKLLGTADFKGAQWAAAAAKYSAAAEYVVRSTAAAEEEDEARDQLAGRTAGKATAGRGVAGEVDAGEAVAGRASEEVDAAPICRFSVAATETEAERARAALVSLATLWLNEAQCHLNLADYPNAIERCTRVLALDSDAAGRRDAGQLSVGQQAKAHFRRALAHMGCDECADAKADLLTARKLEPSNRMVRSTLQECAGQLKALQQREKDLCKRAMGGGSARLPGGGGCCEKEMDGPAEAGGKVNEAEFDAFSFCGASEENEVGQEQLEVVD